MNNKIEITARDILYQYYSIKAKNIGLGRQLVLSFARMTMKKYKYIGHPQTITYYLSMDRPDYQNFMDFVMEKVSRKSKLQRKVYTCINLRNFIIMLFRIDVFRKTKSIILPQVDEAKTIVKPCLRERFIIFFNLIIGIGIYNSFSDLDFSHVNKIVVLGDVWQEESMLVQYANDKGISSITCQHALFIPNLDNSTYDILNIWDIKAKKALLWGQYSENQYRLFNPDLPCNICGNPTIIEREYNEDLNIIGIAMDLPKMHQYNQNMIDVVEEYARSLSKRVRIRIHPTDIKENYRIDSSVCEFSSDLDCCFFIVAHTTTMIFTYLSSGKKVLKFKSDIGFFPVSENMLFETIDELTKCVERFENFDCSKNTINEITYIGEESMCKYKEYIEK